MNTTTLEAPAKAAKKAPFKAPTQFGDNSESYPSEMRTQLWPLCCGARIISGFKDAAKYSVDELVERINAIIDNSIPDHQVFSGEQMMPKLIFLTLNSGQLGSPKIMAAIEKCGFKLFATAKPRGGKQGFFVKDLSNSWTPVADEVAA